MLPKAKRLVVAGQAMLVRPDSGIDSALRRLQLATSLVTVVDYKEAQSGQGRRLGYVIEWDLRTQDNAAWARHAHEYEYGAFQTVRTGKREVWLKQCVTSRHHQSGRTFRLIVRVAKRTIDKHGPRVFMPEVELDGCVISLTDVTPEVPHVLYEDHGTYEQFHSEHKTDLDLERPPSGRFNTNDAILHLAMFAYIRLRLMDQLGLTSRIAPVRHRARRCRLKTVLREILCGAAQFVAHARKLTLDSGRSVQVHIRDFLSSQERLCATRVMAQVPPSVRPDEASLRPDPAWTSTARRLKGAL